MDGLPRQILEKLLIKYKMEDDIIETIDPEIFDDEDDDLDLIEEDVGEEDEADSE